MTAHEQQLAALREERDRLIRRAFRTLGYACLSGMAGLMFATGRIDDTGKLTCILVGMLGGAAGASFLVTAALGVSAQAKTS